MDKQIIRHHKIHLTPEQIKKLSDEELEQLLIKQLNKIEQKDFIKHRKSFVGKYFLKKINYSAYDFNRGFTERWNRTTVLKVLDYNPRTMFYTVLVLTILNLYSSNYSVEIQTRRFDVVTEPFENYKRITPKEFKEICRVASDKIKQHLKLLKKYV